MRPEPVIIRKYPNRRLYDTSAGRYVNLEDVAHLIRQGVDVQVVDARTGDDLTRVILTQIIVEDAKEQPAGLPLDLLRQLVMATTTLSPFRMVKDFLTPQPSPTEMELEQLRRRVAELEARTQQSPRARPKARDKKKA